MILKISLHLLAYRGKKEKEFRNNKAEEIEYFSNGAQVSPSLFLSLSNHLSFGKYPSSSIVCFGLELHQVNIKFVIIFIFRENHQQYNRVTSEGFRKI